MYAGIRFEHLIFRKNPVMSQFYKENFYESGEGIDLNERNVRLAFTVEPVFGTKIMKNDPRYVKYIVRLSGKREG